MDPISAKDIDLFDWQAAAAQAWSVGDSGGAFRGTLEIFTGGGKTVIALECLARASKICEDIRVAVVVPTEALVDQWVESLEKLTNLSSDQIGVLGAGETDTFAHKRCLVCVLNTASRKLPQLVSRQDSTMLIVDECHRAGAPTFSKVLDTPARFRLGLSATPDREEVDEDGAPIEFDEQLVGRALGGVVFRFTLRNAREIGWLPDFEIHHHGVELSPEEQQVYDRESRRIDDLADRLSEFGIEASRARRAASRQDPAGTAAKAYVAATAGRKGLLYKSAERGRVAVSIVQEILRRKPNARVLMFHERVDEAAELHARLLGTGMNVGVTLEHSRLPPAERKKAISDFKSGRASILVSVKSLVEGIDVPEADVGVSVASSSSVRQRIQSLGRVLRRSFGDHTQRKQAEMHLLYVSKTVDDSIYAKEDWADLTGGGANRYWHWPRGQESDPVSEAAPPRTPQPTEEQEWDRLKGVSLENPQPWLGVVPPNEFSVDAMGNVTTPFGRVVANPQGVDRMMEAVRGRAGGRFYVTPMYRFVVIRNSDGSTHAGGRLNEPFVLRDESTNNSPIAQLPSDLKPGDLFSGPLDEVNGSYKLGQKRGGIIERRDAARKSSEYALVSDSGNPKLEENALRILAAWRGLSTTGFQFHLNSQWRAWYRAGGQAIYLGEAVGGFAWPSNRTSEVEGEKHDLSG